MSKQLPTPKASDGPHGGPGMRNGRGEVDALPAVTDFGPYTDAIRRHEQALGRPAPSPTEPGTNGPRLSPAFVEFMMMLPVGHVTDPAIGLSRSQQLKALGNGVVPAQAALALRWLLGLDAPESSDDTRLLPTPTSQAAKHGSLAPVEREGNRPQDDCNLWVVAARMGESLLPTPTAQMTGGTPERHLEAKPGRSQVTELNLIVENGLLASGGRLLPTPVVNDMGDGKTPPQWDQWTDDMKTRHGNGNGHGPSLAIKAQRITHE